MCPLLGAIDAAAVDTFRVLVVQSFESAAVENVNHWPGKSAAREGGYANGTASPNIKEHFSPSKEILQLAGPFDLFCSSLLIEQ
jgi:hypothetical protein